MSEITKLGSWRNQIYPRALVIGLLILVFGISVFLRFNQIGKLPFWNDEVFSFFSAKIDFSEMFKLDPNMSLYNFIAHWWVKIFPNASDGILRVLPAIFSILSIPVVFLLGTTMETDRKKSFAVGLVASTLIAFNAYHIQYAQEFRAYSLLFLFSALSTFILIRAINHNNDSPNSPNPWWFWYVIASTASVYSHFFAVFIIAAQAFSLLILRMENSEMFPIQEAIGTGMGISLLTFPVMKAALTKGSGQISWVSMPTLDSVVKFAIRITGNQGILLLTLYIFTVSIALLVGVNARLQKNFLARWRCTLLANCLFLPIVLSLVLSKILTPIFLDRYLILVMPHLAVLAAVGIVTFVTLFWENKKLKFTTIPVATTIFVLMVILSAIGVKSYFENFQKEDWKGVAQYLSANCSTPKDFRLYYMEYAERDTIYYNPNLKSQVWNWKDVLKKNPDSDDIGQYLSKGYNQACLVISHVGPQYKEMQKNIETAFKLKFPKVTTSTFFQIEVKVYRL